MMSLNPKNLMSGLMEIVKRLLGASASQRTDIVREDTTTQKEEITITLTRRTETIRQLKGTNATGSKIEFDGPGDGAESSQ